MKKIKESIRILFTIEKKCTSYDQTEMVLTNFMGDNGTPYKCISWAKTYTDCLWLIIVCHKNITLVVSPENLLNWIEKCVRSLTTTTTVKLKSSNDRTAMFLFLLCFHIQVCAKRTSLETFSYDVSCIIYSFLKCLSVKLLWKYGGKDKKTILSKPSNEAPR